MYTVYTLLTVQLYTNICKRFLLLAIVHQQDEVKSKPSIYWEVRSLVAKT